jgi:hypothetical protein
VGFAQPIVYFVCFEVRTQKMNFYECKKWTGKRPLGRPRRRWEENIKMDFEEVGEHGLD